MRIGFDAKRMLNNPTGLGNHARILLNALMRDHADNEYLLFTPKAKDEFLHQLHGDFEVLFPALPRTLNPFGHWSFLPYWRSYSVREDLMRMGVDIYHGISNEIPFFMHRSRIRTVVTIHDLIFLKHKEQYPWMDRQVYKTKTKYAAKHADAIIAVSEETKRELMEMYLVPERKISVIYPSVDARFYIPAPAELKTAVAQRYKLPKQYILNVGSFFPRKNQLRLIEAFDRIKGQVAHDLVLVGGTGGQLPEIKKLIAVKELTDRVHIITGISNDDLPAVYQSASLFVFPSLFEGFGAPVLEALFSGTPVIASDRGAIAEAAGKGSILVDPESVEDIAAKILSMLGNTELQKQMVSEGLLHAQTMTDTIFAAKTMGVYKSVI